MQSVTHVEIARDAGDINQNVFFLSGIRFAPLPNPSVLVRDVRVGNNSQFAASVDGINPAIFHNITTPLRLDPHLNRVQIYVLLAGEYAGVVVSKYVHGGTWENVLLPLTAPSQVEGSIVEIAFSDELLSDILESKGKLKLVRIQPPEKDNRVDTFEVAIKGKSGYPLEPVEVGCFDSIRMEFESDDGVTENILCQQREALIVLKCA